MTPQQMSDKYAELAALHAARANGKTLQLFSPENDAWEDVLGFVTGPDEDSDLSRWRVKPDPRRMWETFSLMEAKDVGIAPCCATHIEAEADQWRIAGHKVTEWMEVLP